VWSALRAIPIGQTTTYAELASAIGSPKATRAVGAALGRNPLCILIPCHRVIGSDGSLTGYAGGVKRKKQLLALEGVTFAVTNAER
jgi:methylated-DNA-[protein]-cysteine S-methyltransferase